MKTITTLRKQEQGMGHILMVVLVLVVLGVIGFAGYKVMGSNKKASTTTTSTTASTESKAATSGCEATYHDANLCKFAAQPQLDKVAYKATVTSTDTSGTTSTLTLLSDGKGNTSLSGTSNGTTLNTIQLSGVGYVENAGVWYQYPTGDSSAATSSDPTANMNLVLGAGITYKPLGKEACGSMTCFKYSVSEAATPNATQYAWFDTDHYLLRKWQYTDSTSGTMAMTIDYQSVSITKPSPVQDFSSLGQ